MNPPSPFHLVPWLWLVGALWLAGLQSLPANEAPPPPTPKQLEAEVAALKKENAELKAEVKRLKEVPSPAIPAQAAAVAAAAPSTAPAKPNAGQGWTGNVSLGGSLDRGNTEDDNLAISGEVDRTTSTDKLVNSIDGTFGESKRVTNAERILQATQYDYTLSPRWYFLVHEAFTFDQLAGVRYRGILGPGAGYYLVKNASVFLNVEAGAAGEIQQLAGEGADYSPRALLAENFQYQITPTTRIFENAEMLPNMTAVGDYLMDAHLGIETEITKPISLKFTINDLFNSRPPAGYLRNDLNAVTSIVWKF